MTHPRRAGAPVGMMMTGMPGMAQPHMQMGPYNAMPAGYMANQWMAPQMATMQQPQGFMPQPYAPMMAPQMVPADPAVFSAGIPMQMPGSPLPPMSSGRTEPLDVAVPDAGDLEPPLLESMDDFLNSFSKQEHLA